MLRREARGLPMEQLVRYSFIVCSLVLISFSLSSLAMSRQNAAAQAAVHPSTRSNPKPSHPSTKSSTVNKKKAPILKPIIEDSSSSEEAEEASLTAQKWAQEAKRNGKRWALTPMDKDGEAEVEKEGDAMDAVEMEDGGAPSDYSDDLSETGSEYDQAPRVNSERDGRSSTVAFRRPTQCVPLPPLFPTTSQCINVHPVVEIPVLTQTRRLRSGKRVTVNGLSFFLILRLILIDIHFFGSTPFAKRT